MSDLFTTYPQLVHSLLSGGALVVCITLLAYVVHLRRLFTKDFPGKSLISKLKMEVSQVSGDLADLQDRFSRFQKREGMRNAREQKTSGDDLLREAAAIVGSKAGDGLPGIGADPGGGNSPKADLYRRARKLQ